MRIRGLGRVAAVVALGVGMLAAGSATAEVVSGQPDESIQQAYPIAAGHTYSGAFDNTNYDDADYLAFTVSQPNQTLQFTVANTTQNCADPNDAGCPVYATLMDSTDQQVGGDTSAAGTIATDGDTEVLDWTFASPGTYYLLMESNGDLPPGSPSYSVQFAPAPASGGGGSGGGSNSLPLLRSFKAAPRQHGNRVTASVVLGRRASRLTASLLSFGAKHASRIATLNLTGVSAAQHRLALRLPAACRARLKQRHRLSLMLRLVVIDPAGRASASRHVLLRP